MFRLAVLLGSLGFAGPAMAHTGHALDGVAVGFAHPFHGLDHLLAMAAVGVWAAFLGPRLALLAPACFMAAMALGASAALAGAPLPGVELAIAGSVVALGVLIAGAFRLPAPLAAALVAAFGAAHGHAHGAELPQAASPFAYGAGFLIATGLLHGLGAAAGLFALEARRAGWLRVAGAAVAAAGLWLAGPAMAAGGIETQHAWARASTGAHKTGAAYLTIVNHGDAPDRLVAASAPVAERAELHAHLHEDGVMRMRRVEGIEVNPGEPTVLAPGGLHVMLIGLRQPLKPGDHFPLMLRFEKAGEITVEVAVLKAGDSGPAHATH